MKYGQFWADSCGNSTGRRLQAEAVPAESVHKNCQHSRKLCCIPFHNKKIFHPYIEKAICYNGQNNKRGGLSMEFKVVKSVNDPLFKEAIQLYDAKLDVSLAEGEKIFRQSLENKYTKDDYIFLVGLEDCQAVSLATAHYEATTNSSFLIYLIAKDNPNHDEVIALTLEEIQKEINHLSNQLHSRDVNFIMLEVKQEPEDTEQLEDQSTILSNRRRFLFEHGFEKQNDIDYIAPQRKGESLESPMDLFIKPNIELTKDIYGASIKSNYILKYLFANKIPRSEIYPLLEEMDLRKQS